MPVLYGCQRKLVLLPLAFFILGWLIYACGFIWTLFEWPQGEAQGRQYPSRESILNFPYYVTLVGAPPLYFFSVLFAALPGTASAIMGIIVSFLSTFYFACAGWTAYEKGRMLTYLLRNGNAIDLKLLLVCSGIFLEHFCWLVVLMLSVFYKYKRPSLERFEFLPIGEEDSDSSRSRSCLKSCCKAFPRPEPIPLCRTSCHLASKVCSCLKRCVVRCQSRGIPFTPGIARLISLPFILSSIASWCVLAVGFHGLFVNVDPEQFYPFSFSVVLIISPTLFICSLLHAAFPGATAKLIGTLEVILHVPFVAVLGYIVVDTAQYLHNICGRFDEDVPWENQDWTCYDVEVWSVHLSKVFVYAGGIATLTSWALVVSLWPFYRNDRPRLDIVEPTLSTYGSREATSMLESESRSSLERQQQQTSGYGTIQLIRSGSVRESLSASSCSQNSQTDRHLLEQAEQQPVTIEHEPAEGETVEELHGCQEQELEEEEAFVRDPSPSSQLHDRDHGDEHQHQDDQYQEQENERETGDHSDNIDINDSQPLITADNANM